MWCPYFLQEFWSQTWIKIKIGSIENQETTKETICESRQQTNNKNKKSDRYINK